jgi:hypothetical protein
MKKGAIKFKELFESHQEAQKKKEPKKEEKIVDEKPESYDSVLKTIERDEKARKERLDATLNKNISDDDKIAELKR